MMDVYFINSTSLLLDFCKLQLHDMHNLKRGKVRNCSSLFNYFLTGGGVNSFIRHNRILAFEVEGSHSINSCVIRDRVTSIIILKYENNQLTIVSNGNNNFVIRKNYIFYLDKINNV